MAQEKSWTWVRPSKFIIYLHLIRFVILKTSTLINGPKRKKNCPLERKTQRRNTVDLKSKILDFFM